MARNIIRVSPREKQWSVTYNKLLHRIFDKKEDAVTAGRDLARANQPSQLVVHLADGTIEYEHTYGDDPHPPKG